jgi:hypothetical protein
MQGLPGDSESGENPIMPNNSFEPARLNSGVGHLDLVLLRLSHRSIAKTGYVQRQIPIALGAAEEQPDGSISIIPLRLEQCQVPERLTKSQWVDAFADNGYERLCRALIALKGRG